MIKYRACTYDRVAHQRLTREETQENTQSFTSPTDPIIFVKRSRRDVLKAVLAISTTTTLLAATPGSVFLLSSVGNAATRELSDSSTSENVRWGLLIDTTKCVDGCSACVEACQKENGWDRSNKGTQTASFSFDRLEIEPQWIRKLSLKDKKIGRTFNLPIMCQHCESPPCVDVCPTGASFQRSDGIVLVDRHICIGCRYCMMACPYNARSFVHADISNQKPHMPRGKGCVESCTLCVHRIDVSRLPACVEHCANIGHKALIFGNINDKNSEISQRLSSYSSTQIRADLNTNPGIYYQGL